MDINFMPVVSVIIPTYNAEKFLPETIQSILDQDFDDFEIIIVDDCSTDNTKKVIKEINSYRIRYFCLKKNHGGPSRPRNRGVQEAKGDFIALCDSDDLFAPGRLSSAVNFLRNHPELGMTFTDAQKFDDISGRKFENFLNGYDSFHALPKKKVVHENYILFADDAYRGLFFENYILTCGVTIRREVFQDVGSFDESLSNGDDRDMWFRITREYPIGFINKIGFRYRVRSGSISGRGSSLAENRIKVLQRQLENGLPMYLHKRCQKMISRNYYGIGYWFQSQGQMSKAREYFLLSLQSSFSLVALKGVLIGLIGARGHLWLKKIRRENHDA